MDNVVKDLLLVSAILVLVESVIVIVELDAVVVNSDDAEDDELR